VHHAAADGVAPCARSWRHSLPLFQHSRYSCVGCRAAAPAATLADRAWRHLYFLVCSLRVACLWRLAEGFAHSTLLLHRSPYATGGTVASNASANVRSAGSQHKRAGANATLYRRRAAARCTAVALRRSTMLRLRYLLAPSGAWKIFFASDSRAAGKPFSLSQHYLSVHLAAAKTLHHNCQRIITGVFAAWRFHALYAVSGWRRHKLPACASSLCLLVWHAMVARLFTVLPLYLPHGSLRCYSHRLQNNAAGRHLGDARGPDNFNCRRNHAVTTLAVVTLFFWHSSAGGSLARC